METIHRPNADMGMPMPYNHESVMDAAYAVIDAARVDRFSAKKSTAEVFSYAARLIGSVFEMPKFGKSEIVSFVLDDGQWRLTCTARVRPESGDITRRYYDCDILRVTGAFHVDHPFRKLVYGVPTLLTHLAFFPFKRGKNLMLYFA